MKESKKKDLYFIMLFLVLISCSFIYLFQSSYAKYRRGISGNVSADIASWNIKVNAEEIANKKTLTNTITPVFTANSSHAEGVIAPGVEGYYRITIDASAVDVPFEVTIHSDVSKDSSISDLKTTTWTPKNLESENHNFPYNTETGIVQKIDRNTNKYTFEIRIKWDDENGTMDNQADTSIGIDGNSKALMNVTLHFSQINS